MSRLVYLVASAGLLLAVLPLAAGARPPAEGAPIEAELLDRLRAEGAANFFVKMAVEADLSAAHDMAGWEARGEYVYATLQAVARSSQAAVIAYAERQGLDYASFLTTNAVFIRGGTLEAAQDMAALPGVAYLRLERIWSLPEPVPGADDGAPASWVEGSPTWGILDTGANQVWALGVRGAGIKVANIDSGVQWNHPALVDQFACPGNPSDPACWRDPSNICGGSACDNNGHGTHTMGTMVASDDPGLPYEAGMAPDATWIACKGCETDECSDYALNTCADWILAPGGNTANRPHIVNNSWGGYGGDSWYLPKVNAWRAAGIFPAFSAGNQGPGCYSLGSPGDYQESFASAAHDSNGNVAYFSSRGPSDYGHEPYTKPNLSAPGVSVCSTVPTNAWSCGYSGTSMASPHSAGAVALVWSGCGGYLGQIAQTFELLQNSADATPAGLCGAPPDGEGNYTYGYGYLNVLTAVQGCAVPAAPVLSAISNPGYDNSYLVDWSEVGNATSYTLQEDDNPSFSTPATRYSGSNSQFQVSGQPAGTWYYRVRAHNAAGDSPWSNTESVMVLSVPDAPQLAPITNPGNDDAYLVAWSSVAGALSYTLEEATSPSFVGATTRYAGSAVHYPVTGQAAGTWYYRVRAANLAGDGPWSNDEATTVAPLPLDQPTLSPISNPDGNGNYAVQWSPVEGATGYILEESSSPYFESPAVVYSGAATQFPVSGQPGGTWYYRVRASGPAGNGPWSDSRAVVVTTWVHVPLVMRQYVPQGPPPAIPTLYAIDNPDGDGTYVVLWGAAGGATSYTLQEADNPSFAGALTAYSGPNTSTNISGQLAGTYYYRVNASNAHGTSAWSNVESVVVAALPGPRPGYWLDPGVVEFTVTSDGAYVDDFTLFISIPGCSATTVTHDPPELIDGNLFLFAGSFYGSGIFGSETSCDGAAGLASHFIPGCGYVSLDPVTFTATWQHSVAGEAAGQTVTRGKEALPAGAAPRFLSAAFPPR